ncbi:PREDICTED: uncharacterized protein LOC108745490 isoform X2 [Trachymyrmex septentrionalis]|uniref:uncharacterized protein LOC108745490 isoform X2 n=1 Tax=Trachymyrmex septentrionalis TaxID=34720 RepID=UPI00084F074D|nr:PREDICTED: uncharacterized protein LOC108745490 isoform X2 [Trachymyrmex septentrionalis]
MERLSIILFNFYSLAILAESMSTRSSTMIETSWDNVHDNSTQAGEHTKDSLYLNNASNAFTISTGDFSSSNIKDMQYNENKENDADRKEEPSEDLSSHDILLDPSLLPARLSRQIEQGDVKSNNHDDSKSVLSSKWNLNYGSDLSVAEDRYPSAYPYYRREFSNQRYRANGRKEHYHNYWKYPVFSGK